MLKKLSAIIFIVSLSCLSAQTYSPILSVSNHLNETEKSHNSNINILAVMVEFQPDDFELTYGDGTFGSIYSQDYGNNIIDPLPHNQNYYENHLQFAVNYYNKVSNGAVDVDFTVLPNIVTVSKPMRDYSPLEGESFKVLGDFSKEVWQLVDNANTGFDFSSYNLFIIFHAGAGKDISTNDLFGEARDLPSIYLGHKSLKEFYGDEFNGFLLNDGTLVNNSMILPETESREERGIGGVTLIELSINGLIVSSIASHLGLPDLFDAETGKSAIGRFGLMDGQSLFAFGGLFPPEPSAWEKIFLGWEEPEVINSNTENIFVTAGRVAESTDSKIIKIPINSTEYYLIENRSRDALKDGVTVTYVVGGQQRTKTFFEDLDNFNNAVIDTLNGVVLDVDEFDWALPGNGILIWHIDEKIISQGIKSNRINVGENRGVDLEEADGIQDIGEEFQTIFGDIIIAEGEEFDFWYSNNPSELYENKFSFNTKPSTITNSGSNSLITLSDFSDVSNRMSFNFSNSTENISLLLNISRTYNLQDYVLIQTNDFMHAYTLTNNNLHRVSNRINFEIEEFADSNFVAFQHNDVEFFIGVIGERINVVNSEQQSVKEVTAFEGAKTSNIVVNKISSNEIEFYFGLLNGNVEKYRYNLDSKGGAQFIESVPFLNEPVRQIAVLDNSIAAIGEYSYKFEDTELIFSNKITKLFLSKNIEGKTVSIFTTEANTIVIYVQGDTDYNIIYESNDMIGNVSIADIKNDGQNYIIFTENGILNAVNFNGGSADEFPVKFNNLIFVGTPLIADINNDKLGDIIITSSNGDIYAVSGKTGKPLNNFPLSIGDEFSGYHAVVERNNDMLLSAVTNSGDFYFWSLNSTGKVQWGSTYGNNFNSSSLSSALSDNYISIFFPQNRTYNWPNPVYGEETFIRTYVAEDSEVKVTVFDLAGDLVDEFEFFAAGGLDNEYPWNVSDVQSGAYFAQVEVKSSSGKTESKIIKIAVVK